MNTSTTAQVQCTHITPTGEDVPSSYGYLTAGRNNFSIMETTNQHQSRVIATTNSVSYARKIVTALNRHPKPLHEAKRGEGSVYFEQDTDRWRGEITINGKRRRVSGMTKSEAKRKLTALKEAN